MDAVHAVAIHEVLVSGGSSCCSCVGCSFTVFRLTRSGFYNLSSWVLVEFLDFNLLQLILVVLHSVLVFAGTCLFCFVPVDVLLEKLHGVIVSIFVCTWDFFLFFCCIGGFATCQACWQLLFLFCYMSICVLSSFRGSYISLKKIRTQWAVKIKLLLLSGWTF